MCDLTLVQKQSWMSWQSLQMRLLILWSCSAVAFLEEVISRMKETKQLRLEQPLLYLRLQIARTKLESGDLPSCASTIDEGKDELDSMHDVRTQKSCIRYTLLA